MVYQKIYKLVSKFKSVQTNNSKILPSSLNLVNLYGISAAPSRTQFYLTSASGRVSYCMYSSYTFLQVNMCCWFFAFHASSTFYCQLLKFTYIDLFHDYTSVHASPLHTMYIFRLMTTIFISSEEYFKSTTNEILLMTFYWANERKL